MTYSNNAVADAAAYDDELNRRFNDAAEQDPPQCECCGGSYGVEWLRELERLACEACALAYAVALDEVAATGASREESSMEAMIEAVKEAKRRHPELSDLGIWALLSGGDKDKSGLVGDALNALADEAGQ